jgi:hypothetical protein
MTRRSKFIEGVIKQNQATQDMIRQKFSQEVIDEAKKRLCPNCKHKPCFLLPICLDGSDCSYVKNVELEK